jgi:hypothetical protein
MSTLALALAHKTSVRERSTQAAGALNSYTLYAIRQRLQLPGSRLQAALHRAGVQCTVVRRAAPMQSGVIL